MPPGAFPRPVHEGRSVVPLQLPQQRLAVEGLAPGSSKGRRGAPGFGGSPAVTTLTSPSFERLLLRTVSEGVAAEPVGTWPPQTLQLCLDIVQKLRANSTDARQQLEEVLAEGVEARSFVRECGPLLAVTDERLAPIREAVARVSLIEDTASETLLAQLRLL